MSYKVVDCLICENVKEWGSIKLIPILLLDIQMVSRSLLLTYQHFVIFINNFIIVVNCRRLLTIKPKLLHTFQHIPQIRGSFQWKGWKGGVGEGGITDRSLSTRTATWNIYLRFWDRHSIRKWILMCTSKSRSWHRAACRMKNLAPDIQTN